MIDKPEGGSPTTKQTQKQKKKKQTRTSGPKVRTGCLTCKIRHKKCDETRPSCIMCTSTGRTCDGYQTAPDRRTRAFRKDRTVPTSLSRRASDYNPAGPLPSAMMLSMASIPLLSSTPLLFDPSQMALTPRERHYLDYFHLNTSFQFSAYFGADFWQRIVPQISEAEPALRHAAIAMGALHWNFAETKSHNTLADDPFPLQQCNRAISYLQRSLASGDRSHMETALVTCILFVSFAFCKGDAPTASRLLRGGLKMLREWQGARSYYESSTGRSLVQAFLHMKFHLTTFTDPGMYSALDTSLADFFSVEHLSESIDGLPKAAYLLFDVYALVMRGRSQASGIIDENRDIILHKLQTWTTEFRTSLESRGDALSLKEGTTLTVLEIWSEIIYIMAAIDQWSNDARESKYDMFRFHFERAVNLAKLLLASNTLRSLMPTFSVGTGIIPPLFFCAFKCRDWYVRRDALRLLHGWQCQEGIWKTPATAFVLERLIDIESEGLLPEDIIPESARIESMHVDILPASQSIRMWYRRSQYNSSQDWESELVTFP